MKCRMPRIKRQLCGLCLCMGLVLTGCQSSDTSTSSTETPVLEETSTEVFSQTETETESAAVVITSDADMLTPELSVTSGFYDESFVVYVPVQPGTEVYYTMDGSEPTKQDRRYYESKGISIAIRREFDTSATILKVKAYSVEPKQEETSEGKETYYESETAIATYFVRNHVEDRYSTLIFSVIGEPEDLTKRPDGIFYGQNFHLRGPESERPIYVEAWNAEGELLFSQNAGVRIYGGASRECSIKSMKLFARSEYEEGMDYFYSDLFNHQTLDGSGTNMDRYAKLVLRNTGNDFQFSFIRDELNHRLAEKAGFLDYEEVRPAIAYLNGDYYGMYWLHENYCDEYFKEKYGELEGSIGKFVVLEGGDTYKKEDEDGSNLQFTEDYKAIYWRYASKDLTQDKYYNQMCEVIDVENYLDYFAYNIYVSNKDWPGNNYKCYRYYSIDEDGYGEGVYDGRWRYLLHDVDYTFGLYGQQEVMAYFNMLELVVTPDSYCYAPLFANMMKRDNLREYFINKVYELMEGALSPDSVCATIAEMEAERSQEMNYFQEHLQALRDRNDYSIWCRPDHLPERMEEIKTFAKERPGYMKQFLEAFEASYKEVVEETEEATAEGKQ